MIRGLYVIPPEQENTDRLLELVEQAIEGGAQVVQYRAKRLDPTEQRWQVDVLLMFCRARQVPVIVNDDVELARITRADGVHLGKDDASLAQARQALGHQAIIGISCYDDLARAEAAAAAGANYVAFGSIYPSCTKPEAPHAPLSLLTQAKQRLSIPVVAIGGITADNAAAVFEAGADAVAVVQGVFGAGAVTTAARCIVAAARGATPAG